ncbi:hypothetical protein RFI_15862, partial [Reticulomyxa filosa]
TLSNLLIPLQMVDRNSLLIKSQLRMYGEDKKIQVTKSYFNQTPNFLYPDRFNSDLGRSNNVDTSSTYTAIVHQLPKQEQQEQVQEDDAKINKEELGKQIFIDRLNNLFFYKNESESDVIEFGWIEHWNIPKEAKAQLFPSLLSNVLSYSISALEARFRTLTRQEIHDKLPTQLHLNNTVISSIWAMFATHHLQKKTAKENELFLSHKGMEYLYQSCWARLVTLFGSNSSTIPNEPLSLAAFTFVMFLVFFFFFFQITSELVIFLFSLVDQGKNNDADYRDAMSTQDPFSVMTRSFLTHPHLFSLKNVNSADIITVNATVNDMFH